MIEAAKEEILSPFPMWCADPASAACTFNVEKPHQGVSPQNPALHQGIAWSNSTSALELRGLSWETRVRSRCTGKERDSESGLDEFGARYYGSSLGRFMTPDWATTPIDVPYADFGNPQSLNLYSYVKNNPTTTRDPDGHCCDDLLNFLGGVANAYGSDNLLGAGRVDQTTASGKIGAAVGDFAATAQGAGEALFGGGVEVGGVALDATGVGAVVGVPANVAGAGLMLHGGGTAATGFGNLFKSAMAPKEGESGGPGAGKDFSGKTKEQAVQENKTANGGEAKCVFCGEKTGAGTENKTNIDHAQAKANNGNNSLNNANVTCEYCNKSKGTGNAPKNPKKPDGN